MATSSLQTTGKGDPEPVRIEHFDVAGLPEEQRFAALVAANGSSRLTQLSEGPFAARARFWRMGRQVWVEQWLDPLLFERDERHARSLPADHYSMIVLLDATCVVRRGADEIVCTDGDVIVTDVSREEHVSATFQHSLHIRIPREDVDAMLPPVGLHGPLPRGPATRLFVKHVTDIAAEIADLSEDQAAMLAVSTCNLFAAALASVPPRAEEARDHSVRARAKRHIAAQPMGSLNVDAMCAALGTTRATLYRAFAPDGGVLAYDRKRRLVGLHQAITDPAERRPLATLGFDFGFPDKSHLSRAFRDAFGYSPSQLRDDPSTQRRHAARPGSVQDQFLQMVRSLG
jgi:AraC-like DNA-binding protein